MGITLKQAYEQGSLRIAFYCTRPEPRAGGGFCGKVGHVAIEHAMQRWGEDKPLDAIPARCTWCRSNEFVRVRGEPPGRPGRRGQR
jgi:hypothetical protein